MGAGIGIVLDTPWDGQTFSPPTAIDIATIESAIVTQLQAQVSAIEVAHFPDKPANYRLTHPVGAALVTYQGAEYGELLDTAAIIQERRLKFAITLLVRDLGWSYGGESSGAGIGGYALLEAIRAALTGFQVPGCRKMFPLSERFVERDPQGGVWIYSILFALVTVALEGSMADSFPLFVLGQAQEEAGVTAVAFAGSYTFDAAGQVQLARGNVTVVVVTGSAGQVYAQNADYTVDTVNGIVSLVSGGAIAANATVTIAYDCADVATAQANQTAPQG